MRGIVTGLPPSSFCHPMRLNDLIDFISVERERENRRRPLSTVAHDDAFFLSQLEASDRGAIAYCTFCQRRGSQSH